MEQLDYKEKVGKLISNLRRDRGMTQAELASRLNTSQSAVNRIEAGNQNVSIEMLGRISDVLDREIVSLNKSGTINFRVEGGHKLSGAISVKTSKNAAVGLLCASLLNKGTTTLRRMPRIEEVNRLIEVMLSIGVQVRWLNDDNDLEIKPPRRLNLEAIDAEAARKTRSVIMYMGPLMHLMKEFKLPYAGGCKLGERTVLPHLYALEAMGLKVETTTGWYHCTSHPKAPGKVVMYETSETAAENALMAAARIPGPTVIKGLSSNYMVQDVAFFLEKLGVRITGFGSTSVTVEGVKDINVDVEYYPSEDPIEAMTFLSIAATTNSPITVERAPIDFLEREVLTLERMGATLKISPEYRARNGRTALVDITYVPTDSLHAPGEKIHALPHPGINMDNLPYFVPVAATAHGRTLIHDWSYENRAIYYTELTKLNAQVELVDIHRANIIGPTRWKPAEVICPPALRPAVLILIGMLAADGVSVLRNVYSINRGYEDLAERLNAIGAHIQVLREM
ncbi:UDP-N-acetylglucosamine 1-carboxyvinyltransferase [Candidatus Saccharibacteria bacterium]|nr:UDP-N-acetylglucosamine 1-carboxyvinyltransferase [Candidatus Saccharibacteria bacterium]